MKKLLLPLAATCLFLTGCFTAKVDITKTAKGWHAPANPNDIEILKTRPDRPYEELGDITAMDFPPGDVAKMHNAMRAKAAPLGANAVIITGEGLILPRPLKRWAVGVAIAWK